MERRSGARKKLTGTLRLPARFELIRRSPREYTLVSAFESLSVELPPGADGLLDRVLPALRSGCELKSLVNGGRRREGQSIRAIIESLADRGLIERATPASSSGADAPELRAYARQAKFFANFMPMTGEAMNYSKHAEGRDALQDRLTRSQVLLVGLGRAGSRLAQALAAVGIGKIVGADPRAVAEDDVADSAFRRADVGRPRGEVLEEHLAGTSPGVAFTSLGRPLFGSDRPCGLPEGVNFVVLCEDEFDPDHHAALNTACLDAKVPWVSYRHHGTRLEIGPTVVPHESACFRCYEVRRMSNSPGFQQELEIRKRLAENGTGVGGLNITLGADILALETVKVLTGFATAATYGHVFVMDIVTLESRLHPVLKVPRCPACGKAQGQSATSIWRFAAEDDHDAA
jgi:molybdopterin-synthase adenylyltransferase